MSPKIDEVGTRLRQERERLGLSQTALAELAGVTRNTQGLYEAGTRSPDGQYFAAIGAAGVDVSFVLVGPATLGAKVTAKELQLIDRYRLSEKRVQDAVLALLEATAHLKISEK